MTAVTKCMLCFNEFEDESVSCYPTKLPELVCKYLHSSLTQETLLCHSNHHNLPFCSKCFESVVELGDLNDELEFYQKRISEFVFILSLEILHRRGNSSNDQNRSNHRNLDRKLIEFDVSALPNCDFKKNTTLISEEIEPSAESAQGDYNFNSEDVHKSFNDPMLIPSSTPKANIVEVTLEKIKVDSNKHNWSDDENHDEINETVEFLIEKTKQSISTGQTRNKGSVPILKLKRLNFLGSDQKVILIESDQADLNGSRECKGKKIQTVWTTNDTGSSFKITDAKISTSENCSLQISCMSTLNSVPVSLSNRQVTAEKDDLEKQNYHLNKSNVRTFECQECDKTSTEQSAESQYNSDVGGKMVKMKGYIMCKNKVTHTKCQRRIHTGEKPYRAYKCEVCGKRFFQKSSLMRHKKIHTGEKAFKCEFCGKGFVQKEHLINHKRIHTKEKPYKCEVCGKRCSHKSNLIRHKIIHTGEKAYKCEFCGKGFVQKGHLINHKRIHTGEKPYKCEVCGKRCSHKSSLIRHKIIHTGERPYKCEICGKRFKKQCILSKHRDIHTGAGGKGFLQSNSTINMHNCNEGVDSPNFNHELDFCKIGENSSLNNLRGHKKRIQSKKQLSVSTERPYKCDFCQKTFSMRSVMITHQRSHNGEKPFKCDECDYSSTLSGNLKAHKIHRHSSLRKFKCRECKKDFKTKGLVKQHYKHVHFALEFSDDCVIKNI